MVSKQAALRASVPPELRDWVDNRLVSAHIRMVRAMVLGTMLNALMIAWAMLVELSWDQPALFVTSTLAACLHRLWLAEGIERGRRRRRSGKMMLAFQLNSFWLGLNFGLPIAVLMPGLSAAMQLLLAVCAVSQIASAAYTVRTLPRAALLYVAAQALGISIALLQIGSPPALGAIVVVTAASALLVHMAYTAHDLFVTRILSDRELGNASRTVKLLLNAYEESGSDWLFELDSNHRLIGVSKRFAEAACDKAEALNGRKFLNLFVDDPSRTAIGAALATNHALRDEVAQLDSAGLGEPRWWSISGRPSRSGDAVAYRGVISDVTEQRRAEHRAHRMALFDALTELPNRANFNAALSTMLAARRGSEQIALLVLDIDHFKTINDMHGHPLGDGFLKAFSQRLSRTVSDSGLGGSQPILARLGSDEFAIAVYGGDACDHAVRLAELLVLAMADPIDVDGQEFPSAISLGIALAPLHADNQRHLQSYADIALSAAKKAGRGTWEMFEPGMDEVLHARHTMANDLRYAIGRGELKLFLQPLVDVASEAKTGYEALLRWDHPGRGMIPPDTFIPIAEETGLIVPIGEWVIREAFAEAARWQGQENIAINLSPVQFSSPNLLPVVINALGESGLDPGRVEFEITEGVLLNNSEANLDVLCRLQALGVKIALDDFGTGYASLNYLLTFPFDKIKIDRSFISGLATREESRAIVASVITLANQLGMCTLAEGVEEREQLDTLREQGCVMVQGWLFGKALPSEAYHPAQVRTPKPRPVRLAKPLSTVTTQAYSKRLRG